jgi:hypothetical protein
MPVYKLVIHAEATGLEEWRSQEGPHFHPTGSVLWRTF